MSPAQNAKYWRTWSALCTEHGWKNSDSERRYALHKEAGCPQSMKDFTNTSFDKFLGVAKRLLGQKVDPARASGDGERRRLIWRIKQDAKKANLEQAYLNKLAEDLTGLACWEELALDQLTNFRNAIHNRASHRAAELAHSDNNPF